MQTLPAAYSDSALRAASMLRQQTLDKQLSILNSNWQQQRDSFGGNGGDNDWRGRYLDRVNVSGGGGNGAGNGVEDRRNSRGSNPSTTVSMLDSSVSSTTSPSRASQRRS